MDSTVHMYMVVNLNIVKNGGQKLHNTKKQLLYITYLKIKYVFKQRK